MGRFGVTTNFVREVFEKHSSPGLGKSGSGIIEMTRKER
jgi:hypothetical protein